MSYKGPMLIREPELRWPIVVVAGIVTTLMALLMAALYYAVMTQPYLKPN